MLRKLVRVSPSLLAVDRRLPCSGSLTIPATVPASALGPHTPESRQRQDHVLRRRLRVLPRHARPGRQDASSAAGSALKSPFGTFYAPNISPDPKDGIGGWSEAQFVTAMVKGTSPDGAALLPGVSLHVLSAHAASRMCATCSPISRRCRRCRARCATTTCRFRSTSAARSAAGSSCSSTASRSSRIRPSRRHGIAAPIWSTARAIAPNATARAICSAASSREPALRRRARSGRRGLGAQHHAGRADGLVATRTSPSCSRPARRRDGDSVGGAMAQGGAATLEQLGERTAPRWRPTSSRCRRSKAKPRSRTLRMPNARVLLPAISAARCQLAR